LRVLVVVGVIVYLIYGVTHWDIGPGQPPLVPTHQSIEHQDVKPQDDDPMVIPATPLPSIDPGSIIHYQDLLKQLDDAWAKGSCGHDHAFTVNGIPDPEEPCHMI